MHLKVSEDFIYTSVFDMIRHIQDPEHPNTLEELAVVYLDGIQVDGNNVRI